MSGFLCGEAAELERSAYNAYMLLMIECELDSVRFTGRMEFRDGKWVGTYGGKT